jgi:hypothetical protein
LQAVLPGDRDSGLMPSRSLLHGGREECGRGVMLVQLDVKFKSSDWKFRELRFESLTAPAFSHSINYNLLNYCVSKMVDDKIIPF